MKAVALEQRLREHPDDFASWLAYGDRLLEQGDVRGTLIRLEQRHACVGSADREVLEHEIAALVQEYRHSWDTELPPEVTVLVRRYGFATKVAVEWTDEAPALIEQALQGRFVTSLRIAPSTDAEEEEDD